MTGFLHRWRPFRSGRLAGQVLLSVGIVAVAVTLAGLPMFPSRVWRDFISFIITVDFDPTPFLTYLDHPQSEPLVSDPVEESDSRSVAVTAGVEEADTPGPAPVLAMPVEGGGATSWFGWRIGRDERQEFHPGLDLAAAPGSAVRAAADGTVKEVGSDPAGYGEFVILNHVGGWETLYAHNERVTVTSGQVVRQGDRIALVGRTGNATSPHLHIEVLRAGRPVDPAPYLGLVEAGAR